MTTAADPADPRALLARTYRYIAFIACRWARRYGLDPDDVIQTAAVLILTKFPSYDPGALTPERWARTLTMRAVNILHRRRDLGLGRLLTQFPLDADGTEMTGADPRATDPAEAAADADLAGAVASAVAGLPDRERELIGLRYGGAEATLAEVGAAFGVTGERVRQVEDRTLAKLRQAMGGQDGG